METIHFFPNETTLPTCSTCHPIKSVTFEFLVITLLLLVCFMVSSKLVALHKALISEKSSYITESIVPSLPTLPVIGPLHKLVFAKDQAEVIKSWIATYGTSFRTKILGKEIVFISKPKWLQKLLSSTEAGHLGKLPVIYEILFPEFLRTGLPATSNIPQWRDHRLAYAKAFTLNSLRIYLRLFNKHANHYVERLNNVIDSDFKIDDETGKCKDKTLHHSIHYYAFQIICEVVIGVDILTREEIDSILSHFIRCQDIIAYRTLHPWCWIESVWNVLPRKKEMDNSFNYIKEIVTEKFVLGKEEMERGKDEAEMEEKASIMNFLMRSNLNSDQIYSEMSNTLSAGHETTSVSTEFTLFLLALYPQHQDECRREIDRVWNSLPTNAAGQVELTIEALNEMKYLERCIKESLRIYPAVPLVLRQLSTPLHLADNFVIDSGSVVVVSPMLVHRDPELYPEPNVYNPDRFLSEESSNRSLYSFLTFSQGPRNCIGWKMAMVEMKLLIAYLLRHFEVYTTNTRENLEKCMSASPWPYEDIGVQYRKRRSHI